MRLFAQALILLLLMAFGQFAARAENLLLITVDTLRADHLGVYGYSRIATPNIDRWAHQGVLFERAFSEVPLTLPSHSTILTGTHPFYHGVRDNAGYVLAPSSRTLAEVLKEQGFQTAAFIGAYVLASRFGTAQGFETYDERLPESAGGVVSASALRRPAAAVTDAFLEWLQRRRGDRFFAWVHFYDPHAPCPHGYDAAIGEVDRNIGRIDDALRRRHLLDQTHVIFVADHGESLGEHGESAHGFFLYDATLRVPWIVRPAARLKLQPRTVTEPVSLVDVMPTALQLLDVPLPERVQGKGRLGMMLGRRARVGPLYAESWMPRQFGWSSLRSIRMGRYKLIEAPRPELYDLANDPGEEHNLYSRQAALGRQYDRRLEQWVARYRARGESGARQPVDAATAARLAALGYVALSSPSSDSGATGVDPKDRIQVFETYQQIVAALSGRPGKALLRRIDRLHRLAPEFRGLDYLKALVHERRREWGQAVRHYRLALQEDPQNNPARANLANLYLRARKLEEARDEFREVLSRDPADYRSRNNLALIYRLRGQEEAAFKELERVVREAPQYSPGWLNLGIGLARQSRWEEARRALRKAITLDPGKALAYFHLSRVLSHLGQETAARQAMDTALRLEPRLATLERRER